MTDFYILVCAAFLLFAYGLVSRRLERSFLTGPMVFVVIGALIGPVLFGMWYTRMDAKLVQFTAEIALVVVLFTDAAKIDLPRLIREPGLPARLLAIGLPLTIAAGIGVGYLLMPALGFWAILLLACILAPTDAALGLAIVDNKAVPERLRRAVVVESGLNDGIALPIVLAAIAALGTRMGQIDPDHWGTFLLLQIGLGPIAGIVVGQVGGRLLRRASDAGWVQPVFERLSALALAMLAYAFGELIEGNGFIAAFVAGLTLAVKQHRVREHIEQFGEAEGTLLSYLIFMLFGAVMVPQAIQHWDWISLAYALLSLTVIRMIPVCIALAGSGLRPPDMLLLGWFGPRGIASVLYLLIVIGEIGEAGLEYPLSIVVLTVLLSVILHGVTANPLARLAGKRE